MFSNFLGILSHYTWEVAPSLILGFFLSGLIHELAPSTLLEKYFGKKDFKSLLAITVIGALLPLCCIGALPMAISLRKKGLPLGSILAFLVATPATSVTAILITWRLMGLGFTLYLCLTVIVMGLTIGWIGNLLPSSPRNPDQACPHCNENHEGPHPTQSFWKKIIAAFRFGFIDLPREIGLELLLGLLIAAFVASFTPLGALIKNYLSGNWGYCFALLFGLLTYICSTASVPFVHAFTSQGLSVGAGMVLLIVGPITSYSSLLVIRKEFGTRILLLYLGVISVCSIAFGAFYSTF